MNVSDYFTSISLELNALKNRVRNFIADNQWQTDGEWKESVLRTILRRNLPDNIEAGRGFIVKPDECPSQIDVLIYDASKPVLYKDGELVFVTSDAVKGIIEVKSKIYRNTLKDTLSKLADNAEFAYRVTARLNMRWSSFSGHDALAACPFLFKIDLGMCHYHPLPERIAFQKLCNFLSRP